MIHHSLIKAIRSVFFGHTLLGVTGFLFLIPAFSSADSTTTEIPAGFESLSTPQTTSVDVYYGNSILASVLVTYTPDSVRILQPEKISTLIPGIKNQKKIHEYLSVELPLNSDKVCEFEHSEHCGVLRPDTLGIIFDENRFRVDLFIHPELLETRPAREEKYLPASESGLSLMQSFNTHISGNEASTTATESSHSNYTLYSQSLISKGENSFELSWDYSIENNLSVSQMQFERDFQGREFQAGLINTSGFGQTFSPSQNIWGVRWASSYDTRLDRELTQGSPLDVFLPSRSRVEILKDGRLLSSAFLEAGSQQIDTSDFPAGAYNLVIRVYSESGSLIREETRFFARQSRLPPVGELEFFMEAGKATQVDSESPLPEVVETTLARAGINRRLADSLAGSLAITQSTDQGLFEGGLYYLGRGYELSGTVMYSDTNNYGVNTGAQLQWQNLSVYANYMKLWSETPELPGDQFYLIPKAFSQASLSANYLIGSAILSYRLTQIEQADRRENINTLSYSQPIFNKIDYSATVKLEYSFGDYQNIMLASIELRKNAGSWSFDATPELRYVDHEQSQTSQAQLKLNANYDKQLENSPDEVSVNLLAEQNGSDTVLGAGARYTSNYGQISSDINYYEGEQNRTTSYIANASTSFLTNGETFAFMGSHSSESAVALEVDGSSSEDIFDVLVDGQNHATIRGGQMSAISLPAYSQYKVAIKPAGEFNYDLDERDQTVTLYRGNVESLLYEARKYLTLFGRIKNAEGLLMKNATVKGGATPGNSNDYGLFQVQVEEDDRELIFSNSEGSCTLLLNPEKLDKPYINLGEATCS
ncbi:MAG: TcfC E-set like domain-containing protein [Endozoicomonas sp.]|uniref:TcfC E-set like domain-containing protein n=1 Tax=Endozoicomonas sp. TaxID=1892382 RepID=UPI003D9B4173